MPLVYCLLPLCLCHLQNFYASFLGKVLEGSSGLSPKSFSAAAFIEHMGVLYATTIGFLASFTNPGTLRILHQAGSL